jgi:signal transduction histidine kinase
MGALVHELNQPLTAILSNAQAAQRFLAADRLDLQELREILDDIVMDDKRAAGIVRQIGGNLLEASQPRRIEHAGPNVGSRSNCTSRRERAL